VRSLLVRMYAVRHACPRCPKDYKDRRSLRKHMRGVHAVQFAYGSDVVVDLSEEEAARAREVIHRSQGWSRRRRAGAPGGDDQGAAGNTSGGEDQGATGGTFEEEGAAGGADIEIEMGPRPVSLFQPVEVVSPSTGQRHTLPALVEHFDDPNVLYVPASLPGDRFVYGPLTVVADFNVRDMSMGEVGDFSPQNHNLSTAQVDWGRLKEREMLENILGLGEEVPLADWLESEEFRTLDLDLLVGDTPVASAGVSPSTSGTLVHVMVPVGEEVDAAGERRLVVYTGAQGEGEEGGQGEDVDQEGDGHLDFLIDEDNHVLISRPAILRCGWMSDFLREYPGASIQDLLISWFRGERGTCPQVWRDRYVFASGMQAGQRVLARQVVEEGLSGLDYSDVRALHRRVSETCDQLSELVVRPQAFTGLMQSNASSPAQGDGNGGHGGDDDDDAEEVEVIDLDEEGETSDAESGVDRSVGDMEPDSSVASGSVDGRVYEDISEADPLERDSPESPDAELSSASSGEVYAISSESDTE